MEWSTACPDWERRIVAGQSLIPCGPLFPGEAKRALEVFDELRVMDAPGSPKMGEICRPWIREFVASIFGAYDPETGRRLIVEFFELISKKNTKSTTAAGIMLTALTLNWRHSGEFIILAPTVEIANNSFIPCRDMVYADPELKEIYNVSEHTRTITHRETKATLKVIAADSEAVGGKKAIGVLVDELWLFGKKAEAENMLREAIGGLASRTEGFVIYLSTQSDKAPAGVFRQKLMYARGVRDGRIQDPQFLPVLYEFPASVVEAKGYLDPDNFYMTNPNLGSSVDEAFLQRELRKAQESGEESLRGFLAKHLNVEIGLSLLSDRWAGADEWEANGDKGITLDALLERCEVIDVGLDGGGLDDLFGLCAAGREKETGQWLTWSHAWVHAKALKLRREIAPKLLDLERMGELTIVEQVGEDLVQIVEIIQKIQESELLDKVGLDPAGVGSVLDALEEAGIPKEKVVGISQGWKLMGAIKTTERKLASGELTHDGSQLMAWSVGNAKTVPLGNAVMITKQASGTGKIDPLMALFDAVTLLALNPAPVRKQFQMFFA